MMSLHKLTAGDGYEYLTRQVAAHDSTEMDASSSLESYYSAKGEAPGRWMGLGLTAFDNIAPGDQVTGTQMKALWGEGRHPNATSMEESLVAAGHSPQYAMAATQLGTPFKVYSGANDFTKAIAKAFADYNTSRGEKSTAPIDPEVRAQIRTRVATDMFTTEFGRVPADHRELSGWIAQNTRQKTTAVAGYDLTFSPVKSVSALWAVAPHEVSERIAAAHRRAVDKTMASVERDVAYTRLGNGGVARWQADGLIAAAFDHRDSRAGDPDLHTHVAISNKVRFTGPDGITRWGALDGTPLHRLAVTFSEEYNSRLESEILAEFPGAQFADRDPELRGKRPIRELVGIPHTLLERWSARTQAIEARTAQLVAQFRHEHGREPTAVEHIALRQQANLDTREAKHEPRSLAEQRAAWRRDAHAVLGGEPGLARMVSHTLGIADTAHTSPDLAAEVRYVEGHARLTMPPAAAQRLIADRDRVRAQAQAHLVEHGPRPQRAQWFTDAEAHHLAGLAVGRVALTRSIWQPHHVRAEAMRHARMLAVPADHLTAAADQLTHAALHEHCVHLTDIRRDAERGEPALLRGRDGASVFGDRGLNHFTSHAVLAAERRIIAAAGLTDGRRIDPLHVDLALLEHEANKYPLNAGQQALVREFATTGARFHLALAPAGTGKTSAMAAFTTAWTNAGGTVIGLAPTANAADVLAKDIGQSADTLDKYAWTVRALQSANDDLERAAILDKAPDWFSNVGPGTVVLVDEIGMSSTTSLDLVIADVLARGGDVKGVGDDQQLASVAAGGVLRDVAELGTTLTLTEVMRFTDDTEGAASLAIRDGRDEAIGYYIDHHRIHVTGDAIAADVAYTAWRRDTHAGHASVMLAPTLDTVRELNHRARTDRLADNPLTPDDYAAGRGREVILADGLAASAGDTIRTRRNDRTLRLSGTDFVRNGYRWTIEHVGTDGTLTACHDRSGARITLPADYVRTECELGYASTIHGAQGMTVGSRAKQLGTCHVVASSQLDKQLLYVAMTRATDGNHLYLGTSEADPHKIIFDRALRPPTAVDMLRSMLARDGAQRSATTVARDDTRTAPRLATAADTYQYALGALAEHTLGRDTMTAIDTAADHLVHGLTDDAGWPVLRQHLATLALSAPPGTPADQYAVSCLDRALRSRELDTAVDRAAVLDWRLDHTGEHSATHRGPLPWLAGVAPRLADDHGTYLHGRTQLVTDLAHQVRVDAHAWTAQTAPRWARPLVLAASDHRDLLADLAVFRAAHRVDDLDTRPAGPEQYALTRRHQQHSLEKRFAAAIGDTGSDVARWRDLATSLDPHLLADPFWPDLAAHLSAAARAGVNVHTLLSTAVAEQPLPTEAPAAALWWRVSGDLEPAVRDSPRSAIQVSWAQDLTNIVGVDAAEAILTDPAWPRLVTAVHAADPQQWIPEHILALADELLHAGGDGHHVRLDEYARALAWRVELLATNSSHAADTIPLPDAPPLSIDEEEAAPADPSIDPTGQPADLTQTSIDELGDTPTAASVVDDDYLAALTADEPPAEHVGSPDVDDLGVLDFDDLTADRPPLTLDTPLTTTADLAELRADAAALHAELDDFHALILDPTRQGPSLAAAADDLAHLQQLADLHRPALADLTAAHHEWVDADLATEAAAADLARLDAQLAAAREADTPDEALITRLAGERELADIHHQATATHRDTATHRVQDATNALAALAPTGAVTTADVDRARLAANRGDLAHLHHLRVTARRIDGRLFRAEQAAARTRATVLTLPRPTDLITTDPAPADSRHVLPEILPTPTAPTPPAPVRSEVAARADDYRHARAQLRTDLLRTTAAAVLAPAAVEHLVSSTGADDLAAHLEHARAAGLNPTDVLEHAMHTATTPLHTAADVVTAATPHTDHDILTATRRFEHSEPQRWERFTAADRTSPQWADVVETVRRHALHTGTNPDTLTTWLSLTTDPAAATADDLATVLHTRYPADTAPVATTTWLPGAPLGADTDHTQQLDHARTALTAAITNSSPDDVEEPWHTALPEHLTDTDRTAAIRDITTYRDLAHITPDNPHPLGGEHDADDLADRYRTHLTTRYLTPPADTTEHHQTPPPRPEHHLPPPSPGIAPHHGPDL